MIKIYQLLLCVSFVGFAACGNTQSSVNSSDTTDSIVPDIVAVVPETPAVAEDNSANFDELQGVARRVFAMVFPVGEQSDDFEELVVSQCTPSFIDALKSQNDFEDGSIAWWALRTMEQEGPSDTSEILSITPEGKDAVVVNYLDMGHKASTRLDFVKDGDTYKINSATVTFNGKERTVK